MNYYKRFIGDYGRDTAHLTLCEHGIYALMLDVFYATEKPLPEDKKALCRLLRADDADEKRAVATVAAQFWTKAPANRRECFETLHATTEDAQAKFASVISDCWYGNGGLINRRALREIADSKLIAAKNRVTALRREQAKRDAASKEVAR